MPLDLINVEIKDRKLLVSWSDCSHEKLIVKNYQKTFTCVSRSQESTLPKTDWS